MNRATSAIAAAGHARQRLLLRKANAASGRAEQAVRETWLTILRAVKSGHPRQVVNALRTLSAVIEQSVRASLEHVAEWSYGTTRRSLVQTIPRRQLIRATSTAPPGAVDVTGALRESAEPPRDFRQWLDLLFPPLTPHQVDSVVFAGKWRERIEATTRLAHPGQIAQLISTGLIFGKTHQEIAREIRPLVQGVMSSARRVARTECMRVADRVQMACHEQLGDLVIGYQIHSGHSPFSRHWHVKRDKTIYYKNPGPGQKGYRQMPNPPDEADDPNDRPPGTPKIAYNCLCYRTPVLRPE